MWGDEDVAQHPGDVGGPVDAAGTGPGLMPAIGGSHGPDVDEGSSRAELRRILLVEDDDDDARLLFWSMRRQSLPSDLHRVADLDECLQACHEAVFDVILLDLNLPGVAGFEGITTIRSRVPDPLLIVLTGLADPAAAAAAVAAGAHDYVVKNVDALGLCRSIEALWHRDSGPAAADGFVIGA
jgi:DNA-binding response OmpR family regulator